ncbi:MAG: hypothetical protein ACO1RT_09370 [Planctomycetaceae bacterium]
MSMIHQPSRAVVMTIALACLSGCRDSDSLHTVPVEGRVMFLDAPVKEAQLVFHAVGAAPDMPHRPLAVTDDEGKFKLTTSEPFDGAPPGEYIVTVEQRELQQVGEEWVRTGRNLLPSRYSQPNTSPLRHVVSETPTAPILFELTK